MCENIESKLTNKNIEFQLISVDFVMTDIDFINKRNGFIIDNQGQIFKTEDAGNNWTLLHSTNYELLDIHFSSNQNGYVLAKIHDKQAYVLLKTSDYGKTFQETSILNGSDLRKVFFTSKGTGFVLGNNILKTEDNSLNWSELPLDFNAWTDITEKNNQELYVCGLNGALLKSTNNGTNWQKIDWEINSHLYQMQLFKDILYFRGQNITKTNNRITQEFEIPAYVLDFKVYNENVVIGFGEQYQELGFFPRGAMYISNNSGKQWDTTIFDDFNRIRVVDFIDSNNGFAVADDLFNGKEYLIKIVIEE